jgi:hypothetical protein
METYRSLEDLVVYKKFYLLHIETGERTLEKQLPEMVPPRVDFLNPEPWYPGWCLSITKKIIK